MNKQDRRFQRTQKAIFKAFSALLLEKSLQEMTVNDISLLADINRSTFYLHFEDKFDLLDSYLLSLLPMEDSVESMEPMDSQKFLKMALQKLYDYLDGHKDFFQRLFSDENYPFAIRSTRKALRSFYIHRQDIFSEQIGNSKEFTVHMRIAGLIAMIEWFLSQKEPNREQFVKETYDLVRLLEKAED